MNKVRLFVVTLLILSLFPLQSQAASPKIGRACAKAGVKARVGNQSLTCTRSGAKLIWRKTVSASPRSTTSPTPSASPTTTNSGFSLETLTKSAKATLSGPARLVPDTSESGVVSITSTTTQPFTSFVSATSFDKFEYIGPRPIAETAVDRAGAVGMVTKDGKMAYGSLNALPPWAAKFTLQISDAEGRFSVVTSTNSFGRGQPGVWRLAYKASGNDRWHYQSVSGLSRNPDDAKKYDVVRLGRPGVYSIQMEFSWNMTFYGIAMADTASSVTPVAPSSALKVMIVGDSWTWPVITDSKPFTQWDGYPLVLSWLTGWNVLAAGVPGQGYLHREAGEIYRERLVRDVLPQDPDVVILTGSPNDHCPTCGWSDHDIATEARAALIALRAAAPRALIVLCSAFTASPNEAMEFKYVARELGVAFIDFNALGILSPQRNMNNQYVDGHPTRAGGLYLAQELLEALAKLS